MAILNAEAPEFVPVSAVNTTSALIPYYNNYNQSTTQSLLFYPFYHQYPTYYSSCMSRYYPFVQSSQSSISQMYCNSDPLCVGSSQWLLNPHVLQPRFEEAQVVDKEVVSVKVVSRASRSSSRVDVKGRFGLKREGFKEEISSGCRERGIWKPKASREEKLIEQRSVESVPIPSDGTFTTVMIRNIPNKYTREMLLELLDKHCEEENKRVWRMENSDGVDGSSLSAYDFVYLPIDFGSKCNKGYAFVNFTNSNAVYKLFVSLHQQKWNVLNSKKICEITYARIQGKDGLVKHFQKSMFACEEDEFLPVCFDPHRDGSVKSREVVETKVVGRRILSPSCAST